MRPPSIRLKIALLSSLVSGVVIVAFGAAAWFAIARQKTAAADTELRSLAYRHRGWLSNPQAMLHIDENLGTILGEGRGEELIVWIRGEDGAESLRSDDWPAEIDPAGLDTRLEPDPNAPEESGGRGGGYRGGRGWGGPGRGGAQVSFNRIPRFETRGIWRIGMFGRDGTTLVLGLDMRRGLRELAELRTTFLLALPVALLLVGAGGWLVAGRALRPLRSIARTAEQVTARGLDQRIAMADEDPEISRLIQVLNRMMDRLERSFQQANRFSADASHELKTPLAIMQGELENALQDAPSGSREQQVFAGLLEETQRLKTITSGLLLLSRADAGQLNLAAETVNLGEMIRHLADDAAALADDMDLTIDTEAPDGIEVEADPGLLRTALLNLFVNAVKYNETGGRIEVRLAKDGGAVVFTIGNTGPGIPQGDRERVFQRFQRVDPARDRNVDGVGLGLSLAREIIRAHGGELALHESRPGWTAFEMRWVQRPPR
ncbi:MAG: HAMP domain-containing protein [Akkermansiaceae bacterium]|nr:HAMP domain-containing protein [Akkermansiaceae bacterium]MCP5544615.1 HAMP domain-containing protein [Akkermansiaceae bacterium]